MADESFDAFLSHNSQDKPIVRQLADALVSRGLQPWLDERELVPGRPWQAALEQIIRTCKTAVVMFGPAGLGPWEEPEMRACLNEFVRRKLPVIPLLLPGAPVQPDLPMFLQEFTWVDLRAGLSDEGLDRLVWGITGQKPPTSPGRPPSESFGPPDVAPIQPRKSPATASVPASGGAMRDQSNRSVSIGGNATGIVIQTGDRNRASLQLTQTTLPPREEVNIQAEFAALRELLSRLQTPDQKKIDRAMADVEDELGQPEPDRDEIGRALDRALQYARQAEDFASVAGRLQSPVASAVSWLGTHWHKLLQLVGLTL